MRTYLLTTCNDFLEAYFLKSLLSNENVNCFLVNEYFTTLMPVYNKMFGAGIQIVVPYSEKEKALNICSDYLGEHSCSVCFNCSSTEIGYGLGKRKKSKLALIIISFLLGIAFNNINNTYYCKNCKSEF